jgi:hypothetical protein
MTEQKLIDAAEAFGARYPVQVAASIETHVRLRPEGIPVEEAIETGLESVRRWNPHLFGRPKRVKNVPPPPPEPIYDDYNPVYERIRKKKR